MGRIEAAFDIPAPAGAKTPSVIEAQPATAARPPWCGDSVSEFPHPELTTLSRVHRIQREIEACRPVTDAELLQHARDLTGLMEQAWDAYLDTHNQFALEHARKRLRQRDACRRLLSREWQEGREAEIAAACGAGWFIDQGDKDRALIAANEQ